MSPADELRAAAKVLRETASNATPGPWAREADTDHDGYGANFIANWNGPYLQGVGDTGQGEQADRDAAWIALASPALAEPLAAWLETCANDLADARHYIDEPNSCDHALAVARAINGGPS